MQIIDVVVCIFSKTILNHSLDYLKKNKRYDETLHCIFFPLNDTININDIAQTGTIVKTFSSME